MKKGVIIKGEITAIKPYGAFVKVSKNYVGLIHISQFSDGFVRNIEDYVSIGDVLKLKVIDIDNHKLSLSYKALHKSKKRYQIKLTEGFTPLKEALPKMVEQYFDKKR